MGDIGDEGVVGDGSGSIVVYAGQRRILSSRSRVSDHLRPAMLNYLEYGGSSF